MGERSGGAWGHRDRNSPQPPGRTGEVSTDMSYADIWGIYRTPGVGADCVGVILGMVSGGGL